jgi:hypothetical protein
MVDCHFVIMSPLCIRSLLASLVDLWQMATLFSLSFLCYGWLSFCNRESSLHKVFTCITSWFVTNGNSFVLSLLCFVIDDCHFVVMSPLCIGSFFTWFLLIVCFCFFFGLCLLVFSFALYFWWMGSLHWFLCKGVFFFLNTFVPRKWHVGRERESHKIESKGILS